MKIFLGLLGVLYTFSLTAWGNEFRYERLHNFGIGRRIIPNYRFILPNKYEFPEPLPSTKPPKSALVKQPYRRIHQGSRRKSLDKRVYRREFNYPPINIAQRIKCESLLKCTITYITVNVDEGLPTIFRGGVGYRHFTVLIRANPGEGMRGNITVFCSKADYVDKENRNYIQEH